ncbi:probable mitochondrial glutathione transporter SLC25A40 isoform X2 [Adelges cooleyi]|uniref:probable mitochondrial glutathione transporter SLC25A40 isoform X2 n=1 Tax=Adelges cooleyi TaxID=133065 RepID=UPI0021806A78|nr:probable mitochondrial glutathione transporter SLC25A40 isoform X2 [Adelges cooleyi]
MSDQFDLNIDDPRFRITPVQQMAASCTGALTTSLLVTPLDVIKVRLQAQTRITAKKKCFFYSNGLMDHICPCDILKKSPNNGPYYRNVQWYDRPSHFNGTIDAFRQIIRNEGTMSLWSGLSPTLILALPATIVYFVSYEQIRCRLVDLISLKYQSNIDQNQLLWISAASGCIARFGAATTVSPLELVRTKMQSKRLSYLEVHEALKSLLHYHGYKGLWKGLGSTLLRDVPFSGIYWLTYEKIKQLSGKQTTFMYNFLAGMIAGAFASAVTTPFDVVKTIRQIELAEKEIIAEPPGKAPYSTFKTLGDIYHRNGVRAIFSGLTPRIIKVAPACAIMVSTFEYGKMFFQNRNMQYYRGISTVSRKWIFHYFLKKILIII